MAFFLRNPYRQSCLVKGKSLIRQPLIEKNFISCAIKYYYSLSVQQSIDNNDPVSHVKLERIKLNIKNKNPIKFCIYCNNSLRIKCRVHPLDKSSICVACNGIGYVECPFCKEYH